LKLLKATGNHAMKFGRKSDILLNICLPLALGQFIYWSEKAVIIPTLIKNHLPDGLWAYAFISGILLIWDRVIHTTWIILAFLTAVGYEILQYLHAIPGTGDIKDVITYFAFFNIALLLNNYFKTLQFKRPAAISL
jgi:hypothetical protein